MLTKEQYLNLHDQFYDAFVTSSFSNEGYIPYNHYVISSGISKGGSWMIFHLMAEDFVRELLYTLNGFYSNLKKLSCWNSVLENSEVDYKNDFILEIIEPFASYNLNHVYIVKQRMIYAACMLSHQTLMLINPSIEDKSLVEHNINIHSFNIYLGHYNCMPPFLEALKRIDNKEFRDITSNYRNRYHHQLPPNIQVNFPKLIKRNENGEKNKSYGFLCCETPLKLGELIPVLLEQHQASVNAFQTFWKLLVEQAVIWSSESPNTI